MSFIDTIAKEFRHQAVVAKARQAGQLVYEFRQRNSDIVNQPGPWGGTGKGFCIGMVVKWLDLRLGGQDFDFDRGTKKLDAIPLRQVTGVQSLSNVAADKGKDAAQPALFAAGLKILNYWQRPGTFKSAFHFHFQATGLFMVVLEGKEAGHAIAVQNERHGKVCRFLDPNYGHFSFNGFDLFSDWLKQFSKHAYYDLHSSWTLYHIVRSSINQPYSPKKL